ncbi:MULTISPECIES: ImmA/IrrE family metallo-endopeptidase [Bacillus amyloliquefaciens group]|uniref:ImmA/IrrE family metallo-endopeptidase n=1 Tax=Bacillus velezensis TaxID=492670 RepID=A0ABC8D1M4_BACVE|nr:MULTISPECIES: ImmA/IrrE family metallo-endopeptidase [Bacillus amyloliquefaciens group]AVI27189.1 peptidase [Bacillus velezensis]AWX70838.1 ImmA/IrrE family metallo-endopeptidase [Bacillus velezensis]MDK2559354.1 ImmA/IrrE family metallo-endopeptidase [Bacillus amyloliquefaciens]UUI53186.1 ImmA/IrrE family metallo-endopeptidase [Bacillus velezensis]WPB70849.1 ImmA/IrrE family metallo-endopeptidase [Bacillus velezensis]
MILIYTNKTIKHKTQEIIKKFSNNDPLDICSDLNIPILENDLGQKLNGFLQYYEKEDQYIIQISKNRAHKKFIIAHELGHYFLHKQLNTFKMLNCSITLEEKLERQADIFAAELLITDRMIYDELPYIKHLSNIQLASYFNIPTSVMNLKLEQMNFFPLHKSNNIPNMILSII